MKQIVLILVIGINFTSCKQNKVNGITIGTTLYDNQTFEENQELRKLVRQTLNKDQNALVKLNDFWCGGGAGCYDLGFILTQIVYRLGENDFNTMLKKIDGKHFAGLESLIKVGLEYGDNNQDGKMDNKKFETEFPELLNILNTKKQEKKPNDILLQK